MKPKPRREQKPPTPGVLTSIRLPAEVMRRADGLIPLLGKDPQVTAIGAATRAVVLRLAIVSGLDALEQKYREETPR